jgi:simple sugar transport system ATP-binding protein
LTTVNSTGPIVEMAGVSKHYGNIRALSGVNLRVRQGEVTCILGDNGAGKSTLIKIVSGLHPHDGGTFKIDGKEVHLGSPREALDLGIATVYQDLALVGLMPVWRNFFLGSELTRGFWSFGKLDVDRMRSTADEELRKMGIELPDIDAPVGNLSGGQMQVVAIARAIHFGARVLILDEPTAALGVKQSGVVLKYIAAARDAGLGVIFITHNPHHAYLVGNHFAVLHLGETELDASRAEISLDDLTRHMAGGAELDALKHEMREVAAPRIGALHEVSPTG